VILRIPVRLGLYIWRKEPFW